MNMTSNCDVTKTTHHKQMKTVCHWITPPMRIFCVRHSFGNCKLLVKWSLLVEVGKRSENKRIKCDHQKKSFVCF